MIIFVLIVIFAVVITTAVELIKGVINKRHWTLGTEYDRDEYSTPWIIAKLMADPSYVEFEVEFNPHDGFFYDRDRAGYHPSEIYLKKETDDTEPTK